MILRLVIRAVGTIDERSPDQIRAEAREELGHHMDCLRDELIRGGAAVADLDARVAERFGDAERYAAECTKIALKERVMLQRINLGLLIVLGLAVAWSAWGTARASARSAAALDKLAQRIETLDQARRPMSPAATASLANEGATRVMVTGPKTVARQGVYALDEHGSMTVRRVLIGADFSVDHWKSSSPTPGPIQVLRLTKDGNNKVVFSLSHDEYASNSKDFVLLGGDRVVAP
jgi:hypothetical protein